MKVAKILCPVDFSDSSHAALELAVELARSSRATIELVHVWERPLWGVNEIGLPTEVLGDLRRVGETNLAAWKAEAKELGATEVSTKLVDGAPWDRIVAMAQDDPAIDLIVIGTHGRTGVKRALIGSVAEKVVRHAPCTVTVVRARGG